MGKLVSIIMPVYNAELYLEEAISSVLGQTHDNLELIVVNDGSSDQSKTVVNSFDDIRLKYFYQENSGVAAARNRGLGEMNGEYFCFLDADDVMPPNSILSRLEGFDKDSIAFVGGGQQQMDQSLTQVLKTQLAKYQGNPVKGLIRLDQTCFINCGTWLIKNNQKHHYRFREGWSHSEDLAFFFDISEQGELKSIREIAQLYRRVPNSAMENLEGLSKSYGAFYKLVKESSKASFLDLVILKVKSVKIMFLSYLATGNIVRGINSAIKILLA